MVLIQSYTCACVPVHKDIRKVHLHLSTWRGAPDIFSEKNIVICRLIVQEKNIHLYMHVFANRRVWKGALQAVILVLEVGQDDWFVHAWIVSVYSILLYKLKNVPYIFFSLCLLLLGR